MDFWSVLKEMIVGSSDHFKIFLTNFKYLENNLNFQKKMLSIEAPGTCRLVLKSLIWWVYSKSVKLDSLCVIWKKCYISM